MGARRAPLPQQIDEAPRHPPLRVRRRHSHHPRRRCPARPRTRDRLGRGTAVPRPRRARRPGRHHLRLDEGMGPRIHDQARRDVRGPRSHARFRRRHRLSRPDQIGLARVGLQGEAPLRLRPRRDPRDGGRRLPQPPRRRRPHRAPRRAKPRAGESGRSARPDAARRLLALRRRSERQAGRAGRESRAFTGSGPAREAVAQIRRAGESHRQRCPRGLGAGRARAGRVDRRRRRAADQPPRARLAAPTRAARHRRRHRPVALGGGARHPRRGNLRTNKSLAEWALWAARQRRRVVVHVEIDGYYYCRRGRPETRSVRLGELLTKASLISQDQLKEALKAQKETGGKLGETLIKLGFVSEEDITECLSQQFGVPSINLAHFEIDSSVIKLIPADVARKYNILPVNKTGATITIAMADPTNVFAMDDIKFMTGYNVEPVVASELAHFEIDASVIKLIPAEVARKYNILPVNKTGRMLYF